MNKFQINASKLARHDSSTHL